MIVAKMDITMFAMFLVVCVVVSASGSVINMIELCPCQAKSECLAVDIVSSSVSGFCF